MENKGKLEPKETPRCLIPRLLVVFTRQLEILTTTLEQGVNLLANFPLSSPFFSHYRNMRTSSKTHQFRGKACSKNNSFREWVDSRVQHIWRFQVKNLSTNLGDNQWRIQTFRLGDGVGGGGDVHPDPQIAGGGVSQKHFFGPSGLS